MKIRLNKFLSECGIASRRKVEELIKEGRIELNNKIVTELGVNVDPDADVVKFDGEKLRREKKVYYLLYKPKGFVTTTSDEKNRRTVTELIRTNHRIFPIGRLDYDTTGVLLLTNDGDFSNYLLHPKNKVIREYIAFLDKPLDEKDKSRLSKGIFLDNRKSFFLEIEFLTKNNNKKVRVTTNEGRNHFVKRMFHTLGFNVVQLERIRFGNFDLRGLKIGQYRLLPESEIKTFKPKVSSVKK